MYKIDKNVEIPQINRFGNGRKPKYPFAEMVVGDSFLVSDKKTSQMSSAVAGFCKRGEGKFICRTVEGGVRVWRIK